MKFSKFIIILGFFLISVNASAQTSIVPDSIAKKLGIKTVVRKLFYRDSLTANETWTEYYDSVGKIIKATSVSEYNFIFYIKLYFYNKKGQLIKERAVDYGGNDSFVSIRNYSYNPKGQFKNSNKLYYTYNLRGRLISCLEKISKNSIKIINYDYDSIGRLKLESEEYFDNDLNPNFIYFKPSLIRNKEIKYDTTGRIIKENYSEICFSKQNCLLGGEKEEYNYVYDTNELLLKVFVMGYSKNIFNEQNFENRRIYTYEYLFN